MKNSNFTALCPKKIVIFFFIIAAISAIEIPCPPSGSLHSCSCADWSGSASLRCGFEELTQEKLDTNMLTLRELNNLTETDIIDFDVIELVYSNMETIDLTFLINTRIRMLFIEFNYVLRTITAGSPLVQGEIDVWEELTIFGFPENGISEEGFGTTFTHFSSNLVFLDIHNNLLKGGQHPIGDGSGDIEFLPGFSKFANLKNLDLSYNQIQTLGGGQFKRNTKLSSIDFTGNGLERLDENALLINPGDGAIVEKSILFHDNLLFDDFIHENHGLYSNTAHVTLPNNRFQYLSQANWQRFLENKDNSLRFSGNRFFCDERMEWLRDGAADYQKRVEDVVCTNDPQNTIFTTKLNFSRPHFACPQNSSVSPCTCHQISSQLHTINCEGPEVTSEIMSDLFSLFRSSNNVPPTEFLTFDLLNIEQTVLTELDLSFLINTKFNKINIKNNPNLKSLVEPTNGQKIEVTEVNIVYNGLTNDGIGSFLNGFSSGELKYLNLEHNQISGGQFELVDGSGDVEFLPGLFSFLNLEHLSLAFNKIVSLGGAQFKRIKSLRILDLSDNELAHLDDNALFIGIDETDETKRFIRLSYNKLTELNIDVGHGLDTWSGSTVVDLNFNSMEYLPANQWTDFLLTNNHSNVISFYKNSFICDQRMKWLKDGRADFENRVKFVDCLNDPGHNIFTTDLV